MFQEKTLTDSDSFHNILSQDDLKRGGIIMKGVILCNKCRKKFDEVCLCTPKGNAKCFIKIYHEGKSYEYRRDDQGYVFTYDRAKDKLAEIGTAIKKGNFNPLAFTDAKVKERKFEYQFELWRQEKKEEFNNGELSCEHLRHIESYRKNYLSFFNGYDVREVDLERLSEFKRKELKYIKDTTKPMRSKSQKNILNVLHSFFTWLKKYGTVKEVPAFPEIKNQDKARRRALSKETQNQGLMNIPEEPRDPIHFMMQTGLRPGEVVAVLIKSVDIENRVVWVERARSGSTYVERTKNKEALPVPLNDIAFEIVKRHIRGKFPKDFLFINPNTGKGYTQWFLWDMWKRYSGTDVTLYEATRHSYCSQIVPLTDKLTAQRLMRHRDGRSTDGYYHAYSGTLLDVVQRMGNNVVSMKEANLN
jgi:integrase